MPSRTGLRTVDLLSHDSCVLEPGMGYSYQVLSPTTEYASAAEKAAQIVLRVAPKASYLRRPEEKTEDKKDKWSKFSFKLAFKSMFKKHDTFSFEAQKRVFKGIFDEHIQSTTFTGGKKSRKVYCSAFGAQIFQRAEAERTWHTIVEKNKNSIEFQQDLQELYKLVDELKNSDNPNQQKKISLWAKRMAKKYGAEMEQEMRNFKINFKHTVPQDFVDYFQKNVIL